MNEQNKDTVRFLGDDYLTFKAWIKKNISKIILSFSMMISLTIGITGLVIGTMAHHKTNDLQYYLDYEYKVHWGDGTTIWESKTNDKHKIDLYFSIKPLLGDDIKWNGIYPSGYFDN